MAPNTPAVGIAPAFSAAALALIIDAEGLDQPGRWPGGDSGITLGHGYDLSAESGGELIQDWTPHLGHAVVVRLQIAVGKSGRAAAAIAQRLADIHVTRDQADAVFTTATLSKYRIMTRGAFGLHLAELPLDAQGALVSLVYNRGASMGTPDNDSRREMRAIFRDLADGLQSGGLADIARQLRSMKRLWAGKGLDGLIARREAEALLVERAG